MKKVQGIKTKLLDSLQKFGPAMLPVIAMIPIGGLLLGLGVMMQNTTFIEALPLLGTDVVQLIAGLFQAIGNLIIGNLPIIFACAISFGLSKQDGIAGFSGMIGYLTFITAMGYLGKIDTEAVAKSSGAYTTILGIPTLQTGVFGGMAIGLLVAFLYKKFKDSKLPKAFSFFQGKRFVAIITVVASILLAVMFLVVWPPIQSGIEFFSTKVVDPNTSFGLFTYGIVNYLLVPFGLQHLWYPPFLFQFGSYTTVAGEVVHGDLAMFIAQLADGVPVTAGVYSGVFLTVGVCIGTALAIAKEARPENRKKTLGLYIAGMITVFCTGITEPIEFTFLFSCFPLYLVHCIMKAVAFPVMSFLNVHIASSFCGGLMDYLVYGVFQQAPGWFWVIPMNVAFAAFDYYLIRFLIRKFNFQTPGREKQLAEQTDSIILEDQLPALVLTALGGKENISSLDACATRLRVKFMDKQKFDQKQVSHLGASGVMELGNTTQIIFGTKALSLKEQIQAIIEGKVIPSSSESNTNEKVQTEDSFEEFVVPIEGELLSLSQVPDKVFSEEMMGPGFAIDPISGEVVSPVDGKILEVFPTKHAISILSEKGKEVLIHIGIETVGLQGIPFDILIEKDQIIKKGQPLATVDLEYIKEHAASAICSIVFTNSTHQKVELKKRGNVKLREKDFFSFQDKLSY
ncbi:glucose PTS transporter subunit IIA [Enterococcus sp. AZ196]|uniref:PTS transporter subunit IIABC n=1 Tax=Enterococcus sp. AZ196 TaxID=2774659 RepID=UPI003D28110E